MPKGYCPKCGSRLYPGDESYVRHTGVCSYCVDTEKPQMDKDGNPILDANGNKIYWRKEAYAKGMAQEAIDANKAKIAAMRERQRQRNNDRYGPKGPYWRDR